MEKKKKQIRIMFDYGTYPIWIYDENGDFLDCELVEEIRADSELVSLVMRMENEYEALFINNKVEFSYIGFRSDEDRDAFISFTKEVYEKLKERLSDTYEVINDIAYNEFYDD